MRGWGVNGPERAWPKTFLNVLRRLESQHRRQTLRKLRRQLATLKESDMAGENDTGLSELAQLDATLEKDMKEVSAHLC